jgi:hypothetical protein
MVGMVGSAIAASADSTSNQPYVGGYGKDGNSVYRSDEGFLSTSFTSKSGQVPNQDVLSVLSMAGASGSTLGSVTGFVYQGVSHWDVDGYVYIDPQTYGPTSALAIAWSRVDSMPTQKLELQSDTSYITTDVYWSADRGSVWYLHNLHKTDGTIHVASAQYTKQSWEGSQYFFFGTCNKDGTGTNVCYSGDPFDVAFWQFGVEALGQTGNFDLKQDSVSYVDTSTSTWVDVSSKTAYLVNGDNDYISWWTDYNNVPAQITAAPLGGKPFYNVYAQASSTDGSFSAGTVQWDARSCGGTNCQSDGTRLW